LKIRRSVKQFRLLMVGGAEIVETVWIARLLRERLLKGVGCPLIVSLLVQLNAFRVLVAAHASAAGRSDKRHDSNDQARRDVIRRPHQRRGARYAEVEQAAANLPQGAGK
jgi:hypothetical protein